MKGNVIIKADSSMSEQKKEKREIVIKKNSKLEALKNAPEEVIAGAIHDILSKQRDNSQKR